MIGRTARRRLIRPVVVVVLLGCTAIAIAAAQKANVPKQPNPLVLGRENVRELLLIMNTNANGKISKQEWMKFMEAEFDSLDTSKKGELDPREFQPSPSSTRHFNYAIVGK